ncbi:MAG: hypothetical protein WD887_01405 [Candidatus Saccharimonadales bacterium]
MSAQEDTNWKYESGESADELAASTTSISWSASEYIDHTRGAGWYGLLVLATAALTAGIYFITRDYFASGTIPIIGVVVGVFASRKPRQLSYELSESGFRVGQKTYPYNQFKSFSIIRDGALLSINLLPIKRFMVPVSAYFDAADEEKITDTIGVHLPYEERSMDGVDRLSRRLKF